MIRDTYKWNNEYFAVFLLHFRSFIHQFNLVGLYAYFYSDDNYCHNKLKWEYKIQIILIELSGEMSVSVETTLCSCMCLQTWKCWVVDVLVQHLFGILKTRQFWWNEIEVRFCGNVVTISFTEGEKIKKNLYKPRYRTVGMKPQWNAVLATVKTTPKRSLASGERAMFRYCCYLYWTVYGEEYWNIVLSA